MVASVLSDNVNVKENPSFNPSFLVPSYEELVRRDTELNPVANAPNQLSEWMHDNAAVNDLSASFVQGLRRSGILAGNSLYNSADVRFSGGDPTTPHVYIGDGSYYIQLTGGGFPPNGLTVIRSSDNAVVLSGVGDGQKGWTSDKMVQGLALRNYGYQWLALLLHWLTMPKVGGRSVIGIPVYASDAGPLGPSMVWTFSSRPSYFKLYEFNVKHAGPGPAQFQFNLWNGSRKTVAAARPITLEPDVGYNVVVNFKTPTALQGFVECDPVVAPANGWAISSIRQWPLSLPVANLR